MKASELKGRAVVTLSDAAKVGHVDDVLFDAQYRQVLGFRVKKGALSRSEAIARESVSAIGADAVTVPTPEAVNAEDRFADLDGAASYSRVLGARVVSEGGTLVGTIGDVDLDDEARAVTAYILSASLLARVTHREAVVAAQDVLRLGEGGIMIVSDTIAASEKE